MTDWRARYLKFPCMDCGAKPRERCVTKFGNVRSDPHKSRYRQHFYAYWHGRLPVPKLKPGVSDRIIRNREGCPICDAYPREKCRNKDGEYVGYLHANRRVIFANRHPEFVL